MDKERSQLFMTRLVGDLGTAMAAALVFVGDRTGLFKAMAGAGPLSGAELAERTGIHPRYVEEWLAAMAGAGYVEHDAAGDLFELPDEHALFLTDPSSEYYLGGLFKGLPALMAMAPRIAAAFEHSGGVSFSDFGAEMPVALEQMNRPVYESRLVRSWLPALPEVVAKLQAGGVRSTSAAAPVWCRSRWPRRIRHRASSGWTWTSARSRSPAAMRGKPR